ncbi:MAG: caspase family protein [Gemmatimonadetes bacterium]|nr:caspase family protein [Gemmatimonadota bacterium]
MRAVDEWTRAFALVSVIASTTAPVASAQAPDRGGGLGSGRFEATALRNVPRPVAPIRPIAPRKPGIAGSVIAAAVAGGGAFAASGSACSVTKTAPAPYGGFVDGKYLAAGESITSSSSGCSAGIAAGAAVASALVARMIGSGGYKRSLAKYQVANAQFSVAQADYERALEAWKPKFEAEVARLQLEDERQRAAAVATASTAAAPDSASRTNAAATSPRPVSVAPAQSVIAIPAIEPPKTRFRNPNAVAVVIGNRQYHRPEVPSVEYADRDAELMRRFLVETYGFRDENVIVATNASLSTFQRIFGSKDDYRGQLHNFLMPDKSSDIVVFYSGHGAPDPTNGGAFLVPVDADPQVLPLTAYPLRQLYLNLAQLPARSVTVMLDACFSGFSDRGSLLRGVSPLTLRVENPVLASANAVVLSASAANEISGWYDQKQHGLFTYSLLSELARSATEDGSAVVPSGRQVIERIAPEVTRLSRRLRQRDQTPQAFGQAADRPLPFIRP